MYAVHTPRGNVFHYSAYHRNVTPTVYNHSKLALQTGFFFILNNKLLDMSEKGTEHFPYQKILIL